MKKILGLDLGTNSIGWSYIRLDFDKKQGEIIGLGSRIIPMSQDVLGKFDAGQTISQTADRTNYRGVRRLYQRDTLRRERLHRVLNVLDCLPKHYRDSIDFVNRLGQFKPDTEVKLPYIKNNSGKASFLFQNAFNEMVTDFKANGYNENIPYDWTVYYLRKKALSQKIEKEELAWILLNFNQKRGYYQLRGEEEEVSKNKTEAFYALKVDKVEATEDRNAKGTWYNVVLENGWIYKRQSKTPLFNWEGKTKEFIVTTMLNNDGSVKTDKEGNEKRSFRAVDSEKDWIAIKKKTESDIDAANKTIGCYIYEALLQNPKQKIRGKLIKTIERKYYRAELDKILERQLQEHHDIFTKQNLKKCVDALYPRNEAHQNVLLHKDFKHLLSNDIIFYQRPLKSKKSSIADCPYESRFYKKEGKLITQPLKCISKSNPIYQEFRLWQFIHNLRIYQREGEDNGKPTIDLDVTNMFLLNDAIYVSLFEQLKTTKEVNQKQLLNFFKLKTATHRWNYPEDKKYPCGETYSQIANRLQNIKDVDVEHFLTDEIMQQLWHLIYSVTDIKDYEKAIRAFAIKKEIPSDAFVENFKRFPPFESAYGAYSEKAIKKLLPLMRMGSLWNAQLIPEGTKTRITHIVERLKAIDYNIDHIASIADDDVTGRLLKSFAKEKNRINPLKGLNTYQACYAVYNRHSEAGTVVKWQQPEDVETYLRNFKQHSLRNPIVEQVVLETLRVVKAIWTNYGEKIVANGITRYKPLFDEIHIELGREMKNDKKTRERLSKAHTERENTNARIKAILEELQADPLVKDDVRPYSPSHQEILKIYEDGVVSSQPAIDDTIESIRRNATPSKADIIKYKLWLEQGYISPYTGKIIPLSALFSKAYQIEHIIPQSRYFDNSMANKIICESAVNALKDNKTAYAFIKEHGGTIVDLGLGETVPLYKLKDYENHCHAYFKKNKGKLERLLSEDIPEGFINRQLNDSRYISKLIKGLLSNIVREDGEQEATSKNLVSVTGAITSRLKNDWGLNDKWNEIIAPRFKRLNVISKTQDFGYWDNTINAFRIQVPKALERNFNKKRIDHRHHALDALVVACTTKAHVNYISALNTARTNYALVKKLRVTEEIRTKSELKKTVARAYHQPWVNFTTDAKTTLEKTVVSFKQNNRVINKTNNKTWQWIEEKGSLKKALVKQTKGQNWAIRKPMHKETVSGQINMKVPKGKIATASRISVSEIKTRKRLEAITDISIQHILNQHLKNYTDAEGKENFELAFNTDGVQELNANIQLLNNGKKHQPIKKVRLYEIGVKFPIGETGQKATKFVEAAKGTNLFFNVYWDAKKAKRVFETVPLNEVIAHQKQVAHLAKNERTPVPINRDKGQFLFALSPNDLVYVPNAEEIANPTLVDFKNLSKEQVNQIYKMVSCTGNECHFVPFRNALEIIKNENGTNNKSERVQSISNLQLDDKGKQLMIKHNCWQIKTDRIGNIKKLQ